jgi:hypothetical protein
MRIGARLTPAAKTVRTLASTACAAVALGLSLGLGGCGQIDRAIQPPPVNPSSPIAGYAEDVSRRTFPTPTFDSVPPKPIDIRPAPAYKSAVVEQVNNRRALSDWQAAHQPPPSDTAAWAELQRGRIPKTQATPVSETHDAESEAFAKRLREQAAKAPSAQP